MPEARLELARDRSRRIGSPLTGGRVGNAEPREAVRMRVCWRSLAGRIALACTASLLLRDNDGDNRLAAELQPPHNTPLGEASSLDVVRS